MVETFPLKKKVFPRSLGDLDFDVERDPRADELPELDLVHASRDRDLVAPGREQRRDQDCRRLEGRLAQQHPRKDGDVRVVAAEDVEVRREERFRVEPGFVVREDFVDPQEGRTMGNAAGFLRGSQERTGGGGSESPRGTSADGTGYRGRGKSGRPLIPFSASRDRRRGSGDGGQNRGMDQAGDSVLADPNGRPFPADRCLQDSQSPRGLRAGMPGH